MPPKVRITKEEIVNTALDVVRKGGVQAINARTIAGVLGCSTQPIFSNFATMEELQRAVLDAAFELYLSYLKKEAGSGKYPQYKAFGMAYIRFAEEERELFKLLFMCDREGKAPEATVDSEASVEIIMKAHNISRHEAELMHLEMWIFVHGIATMLATSFFKLEWDLISDMMSDVYQGACARLLSAEGHNNESDSNRKPYEKV